MRLLNFSFVYLLSFSISGCNHIEKNENIKPDHIPTINSHTCYFDDESPEPAPPWLCSKDTTALTSIGSAPITQSGYSAAYELAQLQAKAELSRTINAQITSETQITSSSLPEKEQFKDQIKISSKEILKKARVIKSAISSKKTIYILFGYNQ